MGIRTSIKLVWTRGDKNFLTKIMDVIYGHARTVRNRGERSCFFRSRSRVGRSTFNFKKKLFAKTSKDFLRLDKRRITKFQRNFLGREWFESGIEKGIARTSLLRMSNERAITQSSATVNNGHALLPLPYVVLM